MNASLENLQSVWTVVLPPHYVLPTISVDTFGVDVTVGSDVEDAGKISMAEVIYT